MILNVNYSQSTPKILIKKTQKNISIIITDKDIVYEIILQ